MKHRIRGIFALVTLAGTVATCPAEEEFIFPVGLWVTDMPGYDENMTSEKRVDLRSRGVEMVLLNGDVTRLKKHLAMADSYGFKVYAVPSKFQAIAYYGHDPVFNPVQPYFKDYNWPRFTASAFNDSLDLWVASVVDSLKDYRSLYRYLFWDEPFAHHMDWVRDDSLINPPYNQTWRIWNDYFDNIWINNDTSGLLTDSLGVYTLLKNKIEMRDSLHSVWINLDGAYLSQYRGFAHVKLGNEPNPPHQFSLDEWPFGYNTPIGDTLVLRPFWTERFDSAVVAAKSAIPSNPPHVYVTQLPSTGSCNIDTTTNIRIPTPEEVNELANLAILHEVKGIMHFVLPSGQFPIPIWWSNLWDTSWVPFDAPYEEYVYLRNHSLYSSPDSIRPFNPNDPIHDPFRSLPPRPTDSLYNPRYLEEFYQWKYAPFARDYNSFKEIHDPIHIVGNELLNLWKTSSMATIIPDSNNIFKPEIVTFAPIGSSDRYLFFVNKDLKHSTMGFTVKIARFLPSEYEEIIASVPPPLDNAFILDLTKRHLINRILEPQYINFRVTLGAGEGKLVRLVKGNEIADAMVADPDLAFRRKVGDAIEIQPRYEFTEYDTIQLSVTVYNLGFKPVDVLGVNFYDGYISPQNLIGMTSVILPPLVPGDTLSKKATASINWATDTVKISPHDINVLVTPISDVPERGGNNEAHMTFLIHPLEYATKVVGNPWDMKEPSTEDIDTFENLIETPDSISGVWEGKMLPVTWNPKIHLKLTNPIGSSYNQFSCRMIQDPGGSPVTDTGYVGWVGSFGADSVQVLYKHGQWIILDIDLSDDLQWDQVTDLWIKPYWKKGKNYLIKLAWAKLETKP